VQHGTNLETSWIIQPNEVFAGTLWYFHPQYDDPIQVPLHFLSGDPRNLTPFSLKDQHDATETLPAVDLVITPKALMLVGRSQRGWWVIPREELNTRMAAEMKKRAALVAAKDERRTAIQGSPDENELTILDNYDLNKNGGLDFGEMVKAVGSETNFGRLHRPTTSRIPQILIVPYDKNRDSRIDLSELKELIAMVNKPIEYPVASVPPAMRVFDFNKDGFIDRLEMRAYSQSNMAKARTNSVPTK